MRKWFQDQIVHAQRYGLLGSVKGVQFPKTENEVKLFDKLDKLNLTNHLDTEHSYNIYVARVCLHHFIVIGAPGLFSQLIVLEVIKIRPTMFQLLVYFRVKEYVDYDDNDYLRSLSYETTVTSTLR